MRGTLVHGNSKKPLDGIIPAYAGNTILKLKILLSQWDHPRVCGEHGSVDEMLDGAEGSSPRMRGTRAAAIEAGASTGIIPAYAGNTLRD